MKKISESTTKATPKIPMELFLENGKINFNTILLLLRTGLIFDSQLRKKTKKKELKTITAEVSNEYIVEVERLENTIWHQRLFESILTLGKIERIEYEHFRFDALKISNLYELKKIAGFNPAKSDQVIINMIREIMHTSIAIYKINPETQEKEKFLIFPLITWIYGELDKEVIKETVKIKAKSIRVMVNLDFIEAIKELSVAKIDKELLQYMHKNIKSAYVEKVIKYFITQNTKSSWNIWERLKVIADYTTTTDYLSPNFKYKIETLNRRKLYEIIDQFIEHKEILEEFGITFDKTKIGIIYDSEQKITSFSKVKNLFYDPSNDKHKYQIKLFLTPAKI